MLKIASDEFGPERQALRSQDSGNPSTFQQALYARFS
jgi:hypothetical protein